MRFNYKPDKPLFVVLLRVYALNRSAVIENRPVYAGCRSWVPLDAWVDVSGAWAVFDDDAYAAKRQRIIKCLL